MEPRYFYRQAKPRYEKQDPWKEIKLNRNNWWYVQLNATITTIFAHYKIQDPDQVYVEDAVDWGKETPQTNIYVVRAPITTPDEFNLWMDKYVYIKDELEIQARANSDEDSVIYHFHIK